MCKFQNALNALLSISSEYSGTITTEKDILFTDNIKEIDAFICGYLVAIGDYNINDDIKGFLQNKIEEV